MIFVYSSGIVFFANSVFFRFDPNVIIKSILIVSLIMFIFWIVMNWINNAIILVYLMLKKYPIKTFNFYPFVIIDFNKVKLHCFIDSFMEVYTTIDIEKTEWNEEKLENYHKDYKTSLSILKKVHLILLVVFIVMMVLSINKFLFLFLVCLLAGNICLWNMPNSRIMMPGMYMALKNSTICMFMMFRLAKVDMFDKSILYSYSQKFINMNINEIIGSSQLFLEQIMIDSIYEKRNYLNEETEDFIYKLLIIDSVGKSPFYFKFMVLFAIYCLNKGEVRAAELLYYKIENFCEDMKYCPHELRKKYKNLASNRNITNFNIKEMSNLENLFNGYVQKINWFERQNFKF
jgi:hypothetical protein